MESFPLKMEKVWYFAQYNKLQAHIFQQSLISFIIGNATKFFNVHKARFRYSVFTAHDLEFYISIYVRSNSELLYFITIKMRLNAVIQMYICVSLKVNVGHVSFNLSPASFILFHYSVSPNAQNRNKELSTKFSTAKNSS